MAKKNRSREGKKNLSGTYVGAAMVAIITSKKRINYKQVSVSTGGHARRRYWTDQMEEQTRE